MRQAAPRIRRAALAALAGAALGGCVSLAPEYERPALPVAGSYPAPPSLPASAALAPGAIAATPADRAAVDIPWQQFFNDERLESLIALALQNNRDLRVAVASIEQARAIYQIQRADQVPNVNLGAIGNRLTNPDGSITASYVVGLSLASFELDFFGRVKSLSDAALDLYLASEEARRSAQITLIAAVANAYYSVLADNEQLALAVRTSQTREVSLQLTQLKFDNGVAAVPSRGQPPSYRRCCSPCCSRSAS